jgi:hypothetical protein
MRLRLEETLKNQAYVSFTGGWLCWPVSVASAKADRREGNGVCKSTNADG